MRIIFLCLILLVAGCNSPKTRGAIVKHGIDRELEMDFGRYGGHYRIKEHPYTEFKLEDGRHWRIPGHVGKIGDEMLLNAPVEK